MSLRCRRRWRSASASSTPSRSDIRKSQAIAQRLPQFRAEVADLEMRLETLKNVLPEEKDMGDLLRRLQTLAVQSNLTIRGFKPVETPVAKQLHAEWPINLQLEGAYHNLALFFDRVAKFPRLIHISGIVDQGQGPAGAGFDDYRRLRGDDVRAPREQEGRRRRRDA